MTYSYDYYDPEKIVEEIRSFTATEKTFGAKSSLVYAKAFLRNVETVIAYVINKGEWNIRSRKYVWDVSYRKKHGKGIINLEFSLPSGGIDVYYTNPSTEYPKEGHTCYLRTEFGPKIDLNNRNLQVLDKLPLYINEPALATFIKAKLQGLL